MGISAVLAFIKLIAGWLGHSFALTADGLESISDVFGSFIMMLGLRYTSKPPDKEHPFGHGRVEPLLAMVIIILLLTTAGSIIYFSIDNILTPHEAPRLFTLLISAMVIIVKEIIFRWIRRSNAQLNSSVLAAESMHHRSDAISSLAAFTGISLALLLGKGYESMDDWFALVAAVIILYNCYVIFRPAFSELMDEQNQIELLERIKTVARTVDGISDIEKCYIRKNGMNFLVDIHIEVDGNMSVYESHILAHKVEEILLQSDMNIIYVATHVEPDDNIIRKPYYLK